jgi:hypothetical protein
MRKHGHMTFPKVSNSTMADADDSEVDEIPRNLKE